MIGWCRGYVWDSEFERTGIVPEGDPAFMMMADQVFGGVLTLLGAVPSLLILGILAIIRRWPNKMLR
ncbi:MAG: hypothetical protein HC767_05625 [Akkermansiaceae bacterium]|nr:hypothetical protein [Akkermansiaceae bacterium]